MNDPEDERDARGSAQVARVIFAPWSARTWRMVAHVLLGMPVGALTLSSLLVLGGLAAGLAVTWTPGLAMLAALFWCSRQWVTMQQARIAAFLSINVVVQHPETGERGDGWSRRLLAKARFATTWRHLGYLLASSALGMVGSATVLGCWVAGAALGTVYLGTTGIGPALPYVLGLHQVLLAALTVAGVAALPVSLIVARGVAQLEVEIARLLLGSSQRQRLNQLSAEVLTLSEARAQVIEAADSERRRIERDLHDGVQQQLVSLSMNLGITRRSAKDVPEPMREALAQVHDQSKQALSELRQLVRGMHPAVLDDLGLDAALSGVAARSPVPTVLRVQLPHRPPTAIEAAAYFVVSEALTNVAKHSGASEAIVRVEHENHPARGEIITIEVTDNGRGGASEQGGTGLRGLAQRAHGVGGILHVVMRVTPLSQKLRPPPGAPKILLVQAVTYASGEGVFIAGSAAFFTRYVGIPAIHVGVIISIAAGVALLVKVPLGRSVDRYGARPSWFIAALLQAILYSIYPLVNGFATATAVATAVAVASALGSAARGKIFGDLVSAPNRVQVRTRGLRVRCSEELF